MKCLEIGMLSPWLLVFCYSFCRRHSKACKAAQFVRKIPLWASGRDADGTGVGADRLICSVISTIQTIGTFVGAAMQVMNDT